MSGAACVGRCGSGRVERAARATAAAVIAVAWLAGCATDQPRVLHLGVDEAPEGKRMLWPKPPEVPRYLYAGVLTGEANFRSAANERATGVRRFFDWVVGLNGARERPTVLQRPQTGAVDNAGRIFVTDASRQAVFVFDPLRGRLDVWERATGVRQFANPVGIAAAPGGGVFVADAELGLVARLSSEGEPGSSFGGGVLVRPTGLARDAVGGRVFVADTHAHDLKVFSDAGELLAVWGRRGDAPGEFNFPTHLAYGAGELYVTDTLNHRVQVLDATSGAPLRSIGSRGLYVGNLVRPKGVAVDTERNIYVIESYYDHLLIFDRPGRFLMGFGGVGAGTGRFYLPSGVWTDSLNRVFVADTFNGRIAVYQFLGGGADGEY